MSSAEPAPVDSAAVAFPSDAWLMRRPACRRQAPQRPSTPPAHTSHTEYLFTAHLRPCPGTHLSGGPPPSCPQQSGPPGHEQRESMGMGLGGVGEAGVCPGGHEVGSVIRPVEPERLAELGRPAQQVALAVGLRTCRPHQVHALDGRGGGKGLLWRVRQDWTALSAAEQDRLDYCPCFAIRPPCNRPLVGGSSGQSSSLAPVPKPMLLRR